MLSVSVQREKQTKNKIISWQPSQWYCYQMIFYCQHDNNILTNQVLRQTQTGQNRDTALLWWQFYCE